MNKKKNDYSHIPNFSFGSGPFWWVRALPTSPVKDVDYKETLAQLKQELKKRGKLK